MRLGFKHWYAPGVGDLGRLHIVAIGWHEAMPAGLVDRPQGTDDYLIMRFDSPAQFAAADGLNDRAPGSLAIWSPGHPHYYGNLAEGFVHSWIHFTGPIVPEWLRATCLPVNHALPVLDPLAMDDALLAIHTELTSQPEPDAVIVRNTFEVWLRRYARELRQSPPTAPPPGLLVAKQHLESELDYPWSLEELAKIAGYSKQHFGAEFKKHFGTTPITHLLEVRLRFAAHLLGDQNRRIEDVAHECGFADPFYFSRTFHRHYGASPRAWRKDKNFGGSGSSR